MCPHLRLVLFDPQRLGDHPLGRQRPLSVAVDIQSRVSFGYLLLSNDRLIEPEGERERRRDGERERGRVRVRERERGRVRERE